MSPHLTCDIFCRVIDNYGDIGVCWRLARQLNIEYGWHIRLWVDEIEVCTQLTQGSSLTGIELRHWSCDFPLVTPAEVVIEAFACELPENYLAGMATLPHSPVWLNLEYLCVEDWGPGIHLQPSPHPRLPLLKHFFVPGILPGTGGVLRESDLLQRRTTFDAEAARRDYAEDTSGRWVFLFCYDNPALPLLLNTWAASTTPIHCLVSAGKSTTQVASWLGHVLQVGETAQRGQLYLHALPFVAQEHFDTLLWTCDLNLVRGEDSFCRALWAAVPLVWQTYPQQDNAHHDKLNAAQQHFATPAALAAFSTLWNGITTATQEDLTLAWRRLDASLPALGAHASACRQQLAEQGSLAENLVRFCEESVK